jgi:hypothetical protein
MLLVRIAEAMAFAAHIRRRTALFPALANSLPPGDPWAPSAVDMLPGNVQLDNQLPVASVGAFIASTA